MKIKPNPKLTYNNDSGKNLSDLPNFFGIFVFDGDASLKGLKTDISVILSMTLSHETGEVGFGLSPSVGGGVDFVSGTLYFNLSSTARLFKKLGKDVTKKFSDFINSVDLEQLSEELKEGFLLLKSVVDEVLSE